MSFWLNDICFLFSPVILLDSKELKRRQMICFNLLVFLSIKTLCRWVRSCLERNVQVKEKKINVERQRIAVL